MRVTHFNKGQVLLVLTHARIIIGGITFRLLNFRNQGNIKFKQTLTPTGHKHPIPEEQRNT